MKTVGRYFTHVLLMILAAIIAGFLFFLEEFSRYADDICPYSEDKE